MDGYRTDYRLHLQRQTGFVSRLFNYDPDPLSPSPDRSPSMNYAIKKYKASTDEAVVGSWDFQPPSKSVELSEVVVKAMRRNKLVWADPQIFPFDDDELVRLL